MSLRGPEAVLPAEIQDIQTGNTESMPAGGPPSREKLLWMYERMTLIREFEERLKWLVETGVPVGPVHFYTGQEACAVGVCAALEADDWIASTHRGHGHCIAKGVEVDRMMAELYGKSTGTNRGKGGSMHMTEIRVGMLGVNPIVGMGATHAVGAALSAKVRGTRQVAAAFFGEGAASYRRAARSHEPGGHLEAPGAVRVREQRLLAVHAGGVRGGGSARSQSGPPVMACRG